MVKLHKTVKTFFEAIFAALEIERILSKTEQKNELKETIESLLAVALNEALSSKDLISLVKSDNRFHTEEVKKKFFASQATAWQTYQFFKAFNKGFDQEVRDKFWAKSPTSHEIVNFIVENKEHISEKEIGRLWATNPNAPEIAYLMRYYKYNEEIVQRFWNVNPDANIILKVLTEKHVKLGTDTAKRFAAVNPTTEQILRFFELGEEFQTEELVRIFIKGNPTQWEVSKMLAKYEIANIQEVNDWFFN